MTLRPYIFTFYSYKGGVGRSMALLNVAYTLHSLGRHVLVVDLDLEAPGVSGFLRRNDELAPTEPGKPDVVDLLADLMPALQWEMGEESRPALPVLQTYLRSVRTDIEKYAPARNPRFRRTRLDVLCASDERDYAARLGTLDLSRLSGEQLVSAGNLLREVFFTHQFPWSWEQGEAEQPTRYDYILIDSRTGFTETSGLCIGPLADRLVLFCGLNDQNINGTAEFLKVVGLTASSGGAKWDDDAPEDSTSAPSLGEKPTLLVASPVPFGEMEMKEKRFAAMKEILGAPPDASISYHPRLSVIETVFCRDGAAEGIQQEYRGITMKLLAMVGDHPDQWERRNQALGRKDLPDLGTLRRAASQMDKEEVDRLAGMLAFSANLLGDRAKQETGAEADSLFAAAGEKYQAALAIKPDLHEALNNWGVTLDDHAQQKAGEEADALFAVAGEKYQTALAIKPDLHDALNNWGASLLHRAKQKTGEEADKLFAAAGEKFQAALAIKPDKHEALYNWGNALLQQAQQKTGGEADALYAAAGERYQAALAIKPDKHEALHNMGNALLQQAQKKTGGEADALYAAAGEKYQAALAIKPDKHESIFNWGSALFDQAEKKIGAEADVLFAAAAEKFQAALAIKPDLHGALNNWGASLLHRAKQKTGEEADKLFAAAGEKFQAALAIKPDKHEALNNWGNALLQQAQQKTGAEADALFAAAGEKYQAALAIKPDLNEAFYNLACLHALKSDAGGCLSLLSRAIEAGKTVTRGKLDEDRDFDPIRENPAFISFRDALPP